MEDSDNQSTQSRALVVSSDDLLTEIILRLPITSILRFKSVSKHWRWLLRRFTLLYDSLSKSPGVFVRNTYVENRFTPLLSSSESCFDRYGYRIVQSCNGLLLLCYSEPAGIKGARSYYVYYPFFKVSAFIPPVPGVRNVGKTILSMGLAHQTNCFLDYKVVCVRRLKHDNAIQIHIYSPDTGKWNISIDSFSSDRSCFFKGVYWNGAIHWHPSLRNHLYFNVEAEQLQAFPLPVEVTSTIGEIPMYFGESRGHLHLVTNYCHAKYLHLKVYEALHNHSGWFVKYQVELDDLPGAFPEMIYPTGYDVYVIDVFRGNKEEDTFMVLRISEKIIRYNVHDKSFKEILITELTSLENKVIATPKP